MDAKPGLGGCGVGASNLDMNLDSCSCADTKPGYETWLYLAWIRHLRARLWLNNFYLDVLLVGACFSVCVGALIRMFVHLDSGIL